MSRSAYLRTVILSLLFALSLFPSAQVAGQSVEENKAGKLEVYLVPFSHLDFFWGGTREECLARGNRIIAKAISLANLHPEFRFLLEDDDFVANYGFAEK